MVDVPVSKEVLKWAREFRGLKMEEAAHRLGFSVEELQAYESGDSYPSLGKFEKIASTYRLPQATLFRKTPPPEPPIPIDFRTFDGGAAGQGFEFRVAVSKVRALQKTLRDLSDDDEEFLRPSLPVYYRNHDPWKQGEEERKRLGVTVEDQLGWPSTEAFRRWRAVFESIGIATYLQKFNLKDCRGYSLFEDGDPPAIIVNRSEEYDRARIFTLVHEYAHILIRQPGISDQNPRNPVEAFCNRFAAAFLMPVDALRQLLPVWPNEPIEWEDGKIRYAASRLKVSQRSLALRMEELGVAPAGFYKQHAWPVKSKKKNKKGGGSYVANRLSEIGGRYTSAVMSALDRKVIGLVQAADALAISTDHFDKVRGTIDRHRELASLAEKHILVSGE